MSKDHPQPDERAGAPGDVAVIVFGGTGQTGQAVARAIAAQGARAIALTRRDLELPAAGVGAAQVAYLIAPNMYPDEPELVRRFLRLSKEAGASKVIYHSVAAPFVPAMRHHLGKAAGEDLIRRSGLDWTILQPCAYMQNFFSTVNDEIRVPFRTDAPFGLVDLDDVAEVAAIVSLDSDHVGATYELGGPATVTIAKVARAATALTGRTIAAVAEPVSDWAARNRDRLDPEVLDRFVNMWKYYDRYGLLTGPHVLEAVLGRPGRTIEDALARSL